MAQMIAIANQKGGVGKTTTTVNLAAVLANRGFKTLVVDLDPQGNATTALGIDKLILARQTYDVLVHEVPASEVIQETLIDLLHVCPSNKDLAGVELELVSVMAREIRLHRALAACRREYDFILLDCPPSLGLLTLNALTAADSVMVPLQCEYYALEGVSSLLNTIDLVHASLNPKLRLHGIVLTMFDRRNRLSFQVEADAREHFGDRVYKTNIPRNVRLSESPSFGKPVALYDANCAGARAYESLASEFLALESVWAPAKRVVTRSVSR